MGRQDGVVQLTGGVGNLSFYKTQDGYMARKKTGVSAKRIKSDPAFARTRENIAEFTRLGQDSLLLLVLMVLDFQDSIRKIAHVFFCTKHGVL